jgi:hypothetical protein
MKRRVSSQFEKRVCDLQHQDMRMIVFMAH